MILRSSCETTSAIRKPLAGLVVKLTVERYLIDGPAMFLLPRSEFRNTVKHGNSLVILKLLSFTVMHYQDRRITELPELSSGDIHHVIVYYQIDVCFFRVTVHPRMNLCLDALPLKLTEQLSRCNCAPAIQIRCWTVIAAFSPVPHISGDGVHVLQICFHLFSIVLDC